MRGTPWSEAREVVAGLFYSSRLGGCQILAARRLGSTSLRPTPRPPHLTSRGPPRRRSWRRTESSRRRGNRRCAPADGMDLAWRPKCCLASSCFTSRCTASKTCGRSRDGQPPQHDRRQFVSLFAARASRVILQRWHMQVEPPVTNHRSAMHQTHHATASPCRTLLRTILCFSPAGNCPRLTTWRVA
jgi:hypothetical protein